MFVSSGCLLEPATGFAGSSTIMASSLGFVCTFTASDNWSSSVYCSNVPGNGAVVNSTALMGHGGGRVTCLTAARLAASFYVLPEMAFSNCLLVNGSIISVMHSEVSPVLDTDHWCISNKSIPLCHSPLYLPSPRSVPIPITSLTLLCSSLFPLSHPSSLYFLFHWYPFLCHYDPLVSRISFLPPVPVFPCFMLVPLVPSPWLSQANPAV